MWHLIKRNLTQAILLLLAVAAISYGLFITRASTVKDQDIQSSDPAPSKLSSGITVTAEGEAVARPDTAYLNLGFQTENTSLEAAREEAARQMNNILDKIKQLGVKEKDIQTTNYSIWYDQERRVFVINNNVSVTIRNIESSSNILDEAIKAGANYVSGISFGIENKSELEKQARQRAMENAREKAQQLAQAAGVTLGLPVYISEGAVSNPPIVLPAGVEARSAADVSTPIEPGSMKVTISVQVTFSINR